MEQVILCDSWGWGTSDGEFDVGKYRATTEIKQRLNQWIMYEGVLPPTPFKALREEAQTSIKYADGGQIIGVWSQI